MLAQGGVLITPTGMAFICLFIAGAALILNTLSKRRRL